MLLFTAMPGKKLPSDLRVAEFPKRFLLEGLTDLIPRNLFTPTVS
jgi:hypothetical protein